jgi:hypothetical protein
LIYKELSLEEAYERAISAIEEMCTSTVAMAPYSTPVVGQEQPTAPKKENKHKQKKAVLDYKYKKTWGVKPNEPVVEALMEEIGEVCENILDKINKDKERKQAVVQASAKVLPEREKKLSDIVDKINASPRKDNALEKAKLIAQKKVNKAKKNLGFQVESLIEGLIFEMGRHLKEINPEMYKKYKNMKYIDTDYYPDMPEETKKKVQGIQGQQEKYKDVVTTGELSGDKAMYNIGVGNLKRTQHQLQNLTRAERAKIFKSMGKALNRKIKRDYEERNK